MFEAELTTGVFEGGRTIARAIVCHHPPDGDTKAIVVIHAGLQVVDGTGRFFVGMDLVEGDA